MHENPERTGRIEKRSIPLWGKVAAESFITRTYINLLRRNFKKYKKLPTLSYISPLTHVYAAFRPAYFFFRYMDDLADGDIQDGEYGEFTEVITELREILNGTKQPKDGLGFAMLEAITKLQHVSKPEDDAKQVF